MYLSYNTNGMAFHRIEDALELIAEHGYHGVALTLDHHHLDPTDRRAALAEAGRLQQITDRLGLAVTIETGARYILDPRRKHQPTLLSSNANERARRIEFLATACHVAAVFGRGASVSLWSGPAESRLADAASAPRTAEPGERPADAGARPAERDTILFARLVESLRRVLDVARTVGVRLAFEPEPGMWIERMAQFDRLAAAVNDPALGLTLDVTHVHCLSDGDPAAHIRRYRDVLLNVHVADMRRGVHDHLMFGEGDMSYEDIFAALQDVDYAGPVSVELSRHSHVAVDALRLARAFLVRYVR